MNDVVSQAVSDVNELWQLIRAEAKQASQQQPLMASFFHSNILNHKTFASAMSFFLSSLLENEDLSAMMIMDVFEQAMNDDEAIEHKMVEDLLAYYERDPACDQYMTPFLYFKGYHAIQSYRVAHYLWQQKRILLALYFQSRVAQLFDVDIHPAATLDSGLMIDHATGVVIGETAIIEKNVSMLHSVTLGGNGSTPCKRHPTIREGVLISVGAKVLGNIEVGQRAKIGAGSVVLDAVPAHVTVVGVPANIVGRSRSQMPSLDMKHQLEGDAS